MRPIRLLELVAALALVAPGGRHFGRDAVRGGLKLGYLSPIRFTN